MSRGRPARCLHQRLSVWPPRSTAKACARALGERRAATSSGLGCGDVRHPARERPAPRPHGPGSCHRRPRAGPLARSRIKREVAARRHKRLVPRARRSLRHLSAPTTRRSAPRRPSRLRLTQEGLAVLMARWQACRERSLICNARRSRSFTTPAPAVRLLKPLRAGHQTRSTHRESWSGRWDGRGAPRQPARRDSPSIPPLVSPAGSAQRRAGDDCPRVTDVFPRTRSTSRRGPTAEGADAPCPVCDSKRRLAARDLLSFRTRHRPRPRPIQSRWPSRREPPMGARGTRARAPGARARARARCTTCDAIGYAPAR